MNHLYKNLFLPLFAIFLFSFSISAHPQELELARLVLNDEAPLVFSELTTTIVDATPSVSPTRTVADTPVVIRQTTTIATRSTEEVSEVPVTVGIIGENEILRLAPLSFDDLTRFEPNVESLGGSRYLAEQVTIRGEGGNAVTVRIDGARQNFVSGHTGQRFFVEPDFLNGVDILRGAGSFLYGSGSAGVINLSTLDPADVLNDEGNFGLRIRNQYHTNSDEWAHSIVGAVAGEGIEVLLATSQRDGDNITLSDGVELPFSGIERESSMAKMILTPNSEHRIELSFTDYSSFDEGGANPQVTGLSTTNDFVGREIDYQQFVANYQYAPFDNELIHFNTTFYHNETTQGRGYTGAFVGGNTGRRNTHSLDVTGIDFSNNSKIQIGNREHEIVFGFEYFSESQDGEETRALFFVPGAPGNASGRPDAEVDHFALFLTDEVDLTDELTLFAGLRYDTDNTLQTAGGALSQSDSGLSPNIGFDLDLTENLSLQGRYSRAFTEPTLNDLYQSGSHFGIVPNTPFFGPQPPPVFFGPNYFEEFFLPNPNLTAETSDNFELALFFEDEDFHGGAAVGRLTGFYKAGENTFDTEIVNSANTFPFVGFAGPGTLTQDFRQSVNRAETEIYGVEFTFDYDADVWFASLAAGAVRGIDTSTGNKLNETPGDQVSLTLGSRPTERTELGVYGIWNSGRTDRVGADSFTTNNQPPKGYDIYGLFASFAPTDKWTLRLGVDNLFDLNYQRTSLLQPEPGRNVFISSTLHW